MASSRLAFALLLLVGCAASPPRHEVPAPPPVAKPAPIAGPWAPVYTRHCEGGVTPPVLSPSQRVVTYCNAAFDVERGRLQRVVDDSGALAWVDEERAVFRDYGEGGIIVGTTHAKGGQVEALAVSPRRTLLVTLEDPGALVVRELPSLRVVRSTPVENVHSWSKVGFLADDREVFFDRVKDVLWVVDRNRLVPLLDDVSAVGLDSRGVRAAVVDKNRSQLRLVDLATKKTVATASLPANGARIESVALSDDGRTVAIGGYEAAVLVFEREGATLGLAQTIDAEARDMTFSTDGRTLFVDAFGSLVALRRNAHAKTPAPSYAPKLPRGFAAARKTGEGSFEITDGSRGEPGLIGWYFAGKHHEVEVIAYAHEASEFAGVTDANAWAALVTRRFQYADSVGKPGFRVETTPGGRRITLVRQVRDGCDPSDRYVTLVERDGVVYEIVVEVAPNTARRTVEPLERTFLEEPFGITRGGTSLGFKLPAAPVMPGPC